jgi:hypothetical protein
MGVLSEATVMLCLVVVKIRVGGTQSNGCARNGAMLRIVDDSADGGQLRRTR